MFKLSVQRADGSVAGTAQGDDQACLVYDREYQPGDTIVVESSEKNIHIICQVDDALGAAFVYITDPLIRYEIPFEEKRVCYSPKVFSGKPHYLYVRRAAQQEVNTYRNLALNVMDQHGDTHCFPHASANVETRGESVFAARNAIDGVVENHSHGIWPYASWGINRDPQACFTLEFGRSVSVDKIVLYTRADFPHDSWWTQATFTFSDGTTIDFPMEKSDRPHICEFPKKEISWLKMDRLLKAEDESPFPALSQIEVYGMEGRIV